VSPRCQAGIQVCQFVSVAQLHSAMLSSKESQQFLCLHQIVAGVCARHRCFLRAGVRGNGCLLGLSSVWLGMRLARLAEPRRAIGMGSAAIRFDWSPDEWKQQLEGASADPSECPTQHNTRHHTTHRAFLCRPFWGLTRLATRKGKWDPELGCALPPPAAFNWGSQNYPPLPLWCGLVCGVVLCCNAVCCWHPFTWHGGEGG
jgi:hypothetical protein